MCKQGSRRSVGGTAKAAGPLQQRERSAHLGNECENISRWRLIGITLFAIGITIAQSGLGEDFLLPGNTPGLELLYLTIVGFGLALSCAAALLRPEHLREDSLSTRRRLLAAVTLIALYTLTAPEIALRVIAMPTYFPQE